MDFARVNWRKASACDRNGEDCVEFGGWHKASYSGGNGGGCVEVTATHDTADMRSVHALRHRRRDRASHVRYL